MNDTSIEGMMLLHDRIVRLEAEVKQLRAERDLESERLLSSIHEREEICSEAIAEILKIKAKIERLRSVLQESVTHCEICGPRARAALELSEYERQSDEQT